MILEYTQKVLERMERDHGLYNRKFGRWFRRKYCDAGGNIKRIKIDGKVKLLPDGEIAETLFNKGENIENCCNLWCWDKYEQNKLLDLKKLNRCRNGRFCPNCKKLNIQKFIHEFKRVMPDLGDYDFYMATFTVPSVSCDAVQLKEEIDKIYYSFRQLYRKYSKPLLTPTGKKSGQALQCRLIRMVGGVRVLEITYNSVAGMHPHIHCIVLLPKGLDPELLEKKYDAKWSRKKSERIYKSEIDLQLGKVWSMIYYGIDFRRYNAVDFDPKETFLKINGDVTDYKCLEVDFTPMDLDGVYEVFKYTFKSSEVENYDVFCALVDALHGKRIRQGFGVLYDIKCDDDSDGEKQPLVLEIEEEPEELLTREFRELLTAFADYRKISRFDPDNDVDVSRLAD